MRTSEKGFALIKESEGLRLKAYKAHQSESLYTIGYGHYGIDDPTLTITEQQANDLLKEDVKSAECCVNGIGGLTQNQFDALVDFAYNLGNARLLGSTLLKKIRAKASEEEIRVEFAKWCYCGGQRLEGLARRRSKEADLFFSK